MRNLQDICINASASIKETMEIIGFGGVKIALVVESNNKLVGTINDADIRRSILKGSSIDQSIEKVYHGNPIIASVNSSEEELLSLCNKNRISQIPILNEKHELVDLFVLEDILLRTNHSNYIVLMVGGLGTRLMPLTQKTPKPMLKVGHAPLLETIIKGFINNGFKKFIFCVGYKYEVIKDYFGDGSLFGAEIEYIIEDRRLGTAGALSLTSIADKTSDPFIVMNGDILTTVNYEHLIDFHNQNSAMATMCVREYDIKVPFGVVSTDGIEISNIVEKPVHTFFVNSGIYVLNPSCVKHIPRGKPYDMPSLFNYLKKRNNKVVSFPLQEYWLDIGQMNEFKRANEEFDQFFQG